MTREINGMPFMDDIVIVTELFTIGQDWEVPIPGFFIIAPNRKLRSVMDLTERESVEFIHLLRKMRRGMYDVLGIKDVYLIQNEDTDGNFHPWMFPCHEWMEPFGRKIESVRPIMNYATENMLNEQVFAEVRAHVSKMKKYMNKD